MRDDEVAREIALMLADEIEQSGQPEDIEEAARIRERERSQSCL